MLTFPEGAVGAILAAIIASSASLLGLIVTKEQKISDLRQAWIDNLREDLSRLIAHASEVAFKTAEFGSYENLKERHLKIVEEANIRTYRSKLRLNMKEDESIVLNGAIDELLRVGHIEPHPTASEMEIAENAVVSAAQAVLKREWERVKTGEPGYKLMRYVFSSLLLVAILLFILSFFIKSTDGKPNTQSLPEINISLESRK